MGHSAKNQHILNYKNTIYGFRDLLGRKYSDPYVQQQMKTLPFTIIQQKDDAIGIKVFPRRIFFFFLFKNFGSWYFGEMIR